MGASAAALERELRGGDVGEVLRRLLARPLRDGRFRLPDDAGRRHRARDDGTGRSAHCRSRGRPASRCWRAAAARRNAARRSTTHLVIDCSKHLNKVLSLDIGGAAGDGCAWDRARRVESST